LTAEWRQSFDKLVAGLARRGEIEQAIAPEGLRIPLSIRIIDGVPEYHAIDSLMTVVRVDSCDPPDDDPDMARCDLILNLGHDAQGRLRLDNIRVVHADGSAVKIPGQVRR